MEYVGVITRIEAQKKKKSRLSIFLNDEFAFGLDVTVAAKFNLKKGDKISEERSSEILSFEEKKKIKDSAYRYLARRAHSEKELRAKLLQKRFHEHLVSETLRDLKRAGYVDDLAFARAFARNMLTNKPVGKFRLKQELWQKGVAEEIVKDVLSEVYSQTEESELADKLLQKREGRYKDLSPVERKRRLHQFLRRRGFSWDVIGEVMDAHINRNENDIS